jgi:transposase
VRVTSAFSRLVRLPGVWVKKVRFRPGRVIVEVALRRRRLQCPRCEYSTRARKDTRPVESVWRHLDLGVWRLEIHCRRRRLRCPRHGVLAEGVPFARHRSGFTRDFECLIAWLAARTDKSAICRLLRIDWDTVGRIITRVCTDELDPDRLRDLFDIGVDEVSWKRQHNYLTLVADHRAGKIVWGTAGAGEKAADAFFAERDPSSPRTAAPAPGEDAHSSLSARAHHAADEPEPPIAERAGQLQAISLDMGPGYAAAARWHAPHAVICIDPYHVVQNANKALDEVRRTYWNELRQSGDPEAAKRFKDARWSLLKAPTNLTDKQAVTLRRIKAAGGEVWRAYTLKEATRAIFAPGLAVADVEILIDRLLSRLARSRLEPFIRLGKTIRRHRDGILAAVRLGINQGRTEALNNKVRLIIRRAYGFHTAQAALALVMLTCGPITLRLRTSFTPSVHREADHIDAERASFTPSGSGCGASGGAGRLRWEAGRSGAGRWRWLGGAGAAAVQRRKRWQFGGHLEVRAIVALGGLHVGTPDRPGCRAAEAGIAA